MHARVISISGPADRIDESIKTVKEQVVPAVQGLPGVVGAYWLLDRNSGKARAVILFDSEQSLAQSREAAAEIRERGTATTGATTDAVEEFEVVASIPAKATAQAQ